MAQSSPVFAVQIWGPFEGQDTPIIISLSKAAEMLSSRSSRNIQLDSLQQLAVCIVVSCDNFEQGQVLRCQRQAGVYHRPLHFALIELEL